MSRNQVKHTNVALNKLIYILLADKSTHFKDVKVEESSLRLFNILLVSFQGFDRVSKSTRSCPFPGLQHTLQYTYIVSICNTAYFWGFEYGHQYGRVTSSESNLNLLGFNYFDYSILSFTL